MSGPFESVTKAAIEQILRDHAKESKFGLVLPPGGVREVVNDLYNLVQTSRNLKAAGDRMLTMGPPVRKTETTKTARPTTTRGSLW